MDYLDWWECEEWVAHIKKIYHVDLTDNDSLDAWAREYADKDNVVILPEVWGISNVCNRRNNKEKMIVLPETVKVFMNTFKESKYLETVVIPENVSLFMYEGSGSANKLNDNFPNLSYESRNALMNLFYGAETTDEDDIYDLGFEVIREPIQGVRF